MKKYTLPKEFGTKWIEALRSGEYGQVRNKLSGGDGDYCCLGVACKIVNITDEEILWHNHTIICGDWAYDKGIPTELDDDLHVTCTTMNDEDKLSFSEIADWIETNVELI